MSSKYDGDSNYQSNSNNVRGGPEQGTKRSSNGGADGQSPLSPPATSAREASSAPKQKQAEQALRDAIHHLVEKITKTFIVDSWYQVISSTNHDFVASCEGLIKEVLNRLADLCTNKLDKYRTGQLVTDLLHDHIMNEHSTEKHQSIEKQIDNYEYDIVQNLVVKLFGLLSNEKLQRVVFTMISDAKRTHARQNHHHHHYHFHYNQYSNGTLETSALYTLVIALLTKSVFMPIIDIISEPKWLYAVIIYLCKKEAKREKSADAKAGEGQQENEQAQQQQPNNLRQLPRDLAASTSIIVTDTRGQRDDGFDVASANINFENPISGSLKKPLDNIEIFATEEVNSRSSSYVLYCIRFDGICYRHPSAAGPNIIPENPDVPIIDKRQTHSVKRRANHQSDSAAAAAAAARTNATTSLIQTQDEAPNRKSFRRTMVIKRRFREFVLLQLRLEENPKLRPYLRNIPKPTKLKSATQNIFSLPGLNNIKLDQSTIKLRQRFLERFLSALSDSPFIVNSYEFKEFFSYNVNTAQQLSRSKSTILQVNLNKVFVDSVRSAFSIIRSTLPGDDHQSLRTTNSDPDAWLTELQQSTLKLHVQTKSSHVKMGLEKLIDSKLSSISGSSPTRSKKSSSLGRYYQQEQYSTNNAPFDWMSSRGGSLKAGMVKSASSSSNMDSTSSAVLISKSSSSQSQNVDAFATSTTTTATSAITTRTSKTSSTESVYQDASDVMDPNDSALTATRNQNDCNSIQICDNYPIATKFFDIIYYSISKNPSCHKPFNLMARFLLGRTVERYAAQLLSAMVNLETAALCIEGITSSIWDESDNDLPLDVENATLELAVEHSCRLIEHNYASHTFIPKQLLRSLLSKQLHFYISQLGSQKRNKFVIYAFFVQLIEDIDDSVTQTTATN